MSRLPVNLDVKDMHLLVITLEGLTEEQRNDIVTFGDYYHHIVGILTADDKLIEGAEYHACHDEQLTLTAKKVEICHCNMSKTEALVITEKWLLEVLKIPAVNIDWILNSWQCHQWSPLPTEKKDEIPPLPPPELLQQLQDEERQKQERVENGMKEAYQIFRLMEFPPLTK